MGPSVELKHLLCLALQLAVLFSPGPAVAQSPSDQDLMSLNIEDLARVQVYSASRHQESIREAPSSVTVITAVEIQRYGWRNLGEVLRSVPSFYTSYDRNYSYLGVRGVLRPGDFNSRILVLVDGHRLNDNIYGSAAVGTDFPLDLDLIDHIEVVRGPGSSLFGTNAVFGVINIITRHPAAPWTVEGSADASSFLTRTGRVTVSATHGRFSEFISGSMYQSAGQSTLFFPEFASPATNGGIAQNIDGDRYAQAFSDLQYGNLRVQTLYGSRLKIIPTASYQTNFNDPGTRTTDSRGYLDVDYKHRLTAKTDLDVRAFYDHYAYNGTYVYGGTNSPSRYFNYDSSVADWTGAETTIDYRTGPHHFTLGASYEYSFRVDQKAFDAGQPPALDDHRAPSQAATYGEVELKLGPKLIVHAGGRFDYLDVYGIALSPRAALIYSPTPRTALKYIFGRAFRAPNAYENYYADGVATERPLQPLQKENIQSHELMLERSLTSWLGVTVDGYYNNLDHLIDWVTDPATGLAHAINIGQDRGRGMELQLHAKRSSGLEARASYGLADAYDQVNTRRLDNSPLHQGKLNALIPVTRHAFAGLEASYSSAQTSYQQTRVSPSFLTNLTLSTKPLWGGWEFSASCYNAFDRRWFTPDGPSNTQAAMQQDGRSLRFKLSYRWSAPEKRSR